MAEKISTSKKKFLRTGLWAMTCLGLFTAISFYVWLMDIEPNNFSHTVTSILFLFFGYFAGFQAGWKEYEWDKLPQKTKQFAVACEKMMGVPRSSQRKID